MKILYLANDRPHCTERSVKYALEQHGCDVELCNIRKIPKLIQALRLIREHRPDVLLFSKPSKPYMSKLLEWCRSNGLVTVCWQWDLYFGFRPQRPPQFHADYLFTTDGGHEKLWKRLYPHHQTLRQGVHKPDAYFPPMINHRFKVGFVGTMQWSHPGRIRMIRDLTNHYGKDFRLITNKRGRALNAELNNIRVIVGDSYPAENYWSNRIYEMLGRGSFLVYPKTPGLDAEFKAGEHYVEFERNDYAGLRAIVDHFIGDDDERERIRAAGHEHVVANYTYEHRVAVLLEGLSQATHPVVFAPSRG